MLVNETQDNTKRSNKVDKWIEQREKKAFPEIMEQRKEKTGSLRKKRNVS